MILKKGLWWEPFSLNQINHSLEGGLFEDDEPNEPDSDYTEEDDFDNDLDSIDDAPIEELEAMEGAED